MQQSDPAKQFPRSAAVLGPGAVGGLIAGVLARQGIHVTCIGRRETCELLVRDGISVRSERFGNFHVTVASAEVLVTPVDVCFVTVKATQMDAALERVPRDRIVDGLVVPFLNGIEHVATLRKRYGEAVVPATIRIEAKRSSQNTIEHVSKFAAIELGAADAGGRGRFNEVRLLKESLVSAGFDVAIRDDEEAMLWSKLSFLAPLALLTTHENAPAGSIRSTHRSTLLAVINEVVTVAGHAGAAISEDTVVALFDSIPETMQSSMQRDAVSGKAIEIDAIGGAILREARRHNVSVPHTERLVTDLTTRYGTPAGGPETPR
jgi:2-dehydropantoate 2-reductase